MYPERALVIGSSGGLGRAFVQALVSRGTDTVTLSRQEDGFDLTCPDRVDHLLSRLDGTFDLILIATGALEIAGVRPEKSLRSIEAAALADQFAVNAIGPALILRHVPRILPRDRPAKVAALSPRVGSIGDNRLGGWYGYRASKAALNQIVRTASIELSRSHPKAVCVALHPGTVATPFTARYVTAAKATPPLAAAENLLRVLAGMGASNSGGFYDYSGKAVPW